MRDEFRRALDAAARHAIAYREDAPGRRHSPVHTYAQARAAFAAPTPESGEAPEQVIADLVAAAGPGLAGMTGPRFFGWVVGGSHPVGLAADWLTGAWGQNAGNHAGTPAAAAAEETAAAWLLDLLALPDDASVGFVTGASIANFTCLAAARSAALATAGWDCEADGLFGAPPITVALGAEAHASVFQALKYLGLGARRVALIEADAQGRMRPDALARALVGATGPTIVIAQAGHLHSGAFDPFDEISAIAKAHGAWLHVDGAFGLWARAAPETITLTAGVEHADSWSVDGHKWLQTPYDCGYAIVRDADAHRRAMTLTASYLPAAGADRNPADYVPELSRRARGFATWAMIRALGRDGMAALVAGHCALAQRFARRLRDEPGVTIVNDVTLNQVAVRFGADRGDDRGDALTRGVVARVQAEGECFVGGAVWRGREIVRISVINAQTTPADIDRAAAAIIAAWRAVAQDGDD